MKKVLIRAACFSGGVVAGYIVATAVIFVIDVVKER